MTRRVVITGIGAITSLGHTAHDTFKALMEGKSGVGPITYFDVSQYACRIAAQLRDFDPVTVVPKHDVRKLDPFTLYGMAAANEAMSDSGLGDGDFEPDRAGCIMGVGIGGLTDIEAHKELVLARGPRRIKPFFIPKIMMNAVSGRVSMTHGLRGPNFVTASACASSTHAMGLAHRSIQCGDADMMVTGGSEATITTLGVGGFCALKAMSTRNDDPTAASRPFDKGRDGFVMGEGGGALVFEEYEHAKARGARIYAEVTGFGMTADAHHITAPAPGGVGAARSMRMCLESAGVNPEDVTYINAHGTSTPINDPLETQAMKAVFGAHAHDVAISSSKSMIGHLLGGAGAVELTISALSIFEGKVHPTINQEEKDPDCDLDYIPNVGRDLDVRHALSNSLGFGGHNATILISKI